MKIDIRSEWPIREDWWDKLLGFTGYAEIAGKRVPVRGIYKQFKKDSSLVTAGTRRICRLEFRLSSGGRLITAVWYAPLREPEVLQCDSADAEAVLRCVDPWITRIE